jgi:hypothetical protein
LIIYEPKSRCGSLGQGETSLNQVSSGLRVEFKENTSFFFLFKATVTLQMIATIIIYLKQLGAVLTQICISKLATQKAKEKDLGRHKEPLVVLPISD